MKQFLLLLFCCSLSLICAAQDKHFTQFYATPLTLNPALTGAYDGRYRVYGIYRDQWRGVLESPYVTIAAGMDVRWDTELDSRYKDAFAVGLLFYNDKVGGIDFNTNQIAISAAFHKGLDFDKRQFLSLGIQGAVAQRNINYEDLTFDDQFNDLNGYDKPTLENLPENNFSFSDLNVGLNYTFTPKSDMAVYAGLALHHVLRPQLSFYPAEDGGDSRLYMKISGQLSVQLPLNDRMSVIPRALVAKQGPHTEINVGTNLRYKLNDYNSNAIQFGSWVRPVSNEDNSLGLDALIVLVGFEFNSVLLGLSYDINLDDAANYKQGQNAFEFSATYQGSFEDESILCPKF